MVRILLYRIKFQWINPVLVVSVYWISAILSRIPFRNMTSPWGSVLWAVKIPATHIWEYLSRISSETAQLSRFVQHFTKEKYQISAFNHSLNIGIVRLCQNLITVVLKVFHQASNWVIWWYSNTLYGWFMNLLSISICIIFDPSYSICTLLCPPLWKFYL